MSRLSSDRSLQAPTFADVNDDGLLEVLMGGTNGAIYVLMGDSGQNAPNFPVYAQVQESKTRQ